MVDDDPISPRTARYLMAGFVVLLAILLLVFFYTDGFSYVGVR